MEEILLITIILLHSSITLTSILLTKELHEVCLLLNSSTAS